MSTMIHNVPQINTRL